MDWTWDPRKAAANFAKHGVLFETAVLVFDDPHLIFGPDPHPDDDRWQSIGMVALATLFVVHTEIDADGTGRIISARRATPSERRTYEAARF
jgi:uncharacterized DUF497 family protein